MPNLKKKSVCHRGFTFVELITVLIIIGIGITIFYSSLSLYWTSADHFMTRADMWQDVNAIVDIMTLDGRDARTIAVDAGNKSSTFTDENDNIIAVYTMTGNQLVRIPNGTSTPFTLTTQLDNDASTFSKSGKALVMNLALSSAILSRELNVVTATEIYPRN